MLRNLSIALSVAGLFALAAACSDDDGNKKTDGGVTLLDGPNPRQDGTTPNADSGTPNDLDCMGIVQCAASCTTQPCVDACLAQAVSAAEADKFNALDDCSQAAFLGACATPCATPTDTACGTCLQTECGAELSACQGGGGPPEEGFGDQCNVSTAPCGTGFTCLPFAQNGDGFCSKSCDNPLGQCTGAPTGTFAGCLIPDGQNGYFCGFVCKLGTNEFPCPDTLVCSTEEDPPGSGQYSCMPAPAQ